MHRIIHITTNLQSDVTEELRYISPAKYFLLSHLSGCAISDVAMRTHVSLLITSASANCRAIATALNLHGYGNP
jgi:hypothetical protein